MYLFSKEIKIRNLFGPFHNSTIMLCNVALHWLLIFLAFYFNHSTFSPRRAHSYGHVTINKVVEPPPPPPAPAPLIIIHTAPRRRVVHPTTHTVQHPGSAPWVRVPPPPRHQGTYPGLLTQGTRPKATGFPRAPELTGTRGCWPLVAIKC